jgi:hypothetical protein
MASRFLPLRRSARFTLWAAGGAAALSAAAALTLDAGWASLALLGAGAFVACALYAVLGMSRYALAAVACGGSALAIGSALTFLRMLGLAWDQDPNSVTTVSSQDADPYFFGAVAAAAFTLAVLLVGAVWPEPRPAAARSRPAALRSSRGPGRTASPARKRSSARKSVPRKAPAPAVRQAQVTVRRIPVGPKGVSASARAARRS